MDVESGKAKIVGRDPWMVPQRTVNPTWSPDSKWVAYAAHLNSLYKAIFISNAETGETKQVTDGLADTTWPVLDAGGKYLWFFASTDFGLRSQWLDMTSYDHNENLRPLSRGPEERRAESAAAGERRGHRRHLRAGPRRAGRRQGGRGGRGRGGAPGDTTADTGAAGETPQATPNPNQPDRAPRTGRSPCRSTSTDCRSASSRFPACRRATTPS